MRSLAASILLTIVVLLSASCQNALPLSSPLDSPLNPTQDVVQHQVSGYLVRLNNSPIRGVKVYAATLLNNAAQGEFETYVVDPAITPSAATDEQGFLYFDGLPVGKYALVADIIIAKILLEDANGKPILFEITDEQARVSLGTRRVKFDLPDESR
jgi:hypothetical protein